MRLEVPCRGGGVVAEVAFEALLALVRLQVRLELVAVGEALVAPLARQHLVAGVQLLHVNAQVGLSAAGGRTELALQGGREERRGKERKEEDGTFIIIKGFEMLTLLLFNTCLKDGLIAGVNEAVGLQRVGLREALVADVAAVRLFACGR